jgi:hypothetical protein
MFRMNRLVVAMFAAAAAAACASDGALVDVQGSCADVHGAQVCTWATTRGSSLVEAGAVVPIGSIENAPEHGPMTWPPAASAKIELPQSVRLQSGLSELTVFWESMGHPPGPYLTPHFDFHFYTIPSAEREAIDCTDLSKPAALPAAYGLPDVDLPPDMAQLTGLPTLVGLCVPTMGMHSLLDSEMKGADTFRATMVVGYYRGKPIFIEPMVTRAMLMEKKSFDLAIPSVPGMGAHPTRFRAEYDAAQSAYRFTFSAFVPSA